MVETVNVEKGDINGRDSNEQEGRDNNDGNETIVRNSVRTMKIVETVKVKNKDEKVEAVQVKKTVQPR